MHQYQDGLYQQIAQSAGIYAGQKLSNMLNRTYQGYRRKRSYPKSAFARTKKRQRYGAHTSELKFRNTELVNAPITTSWVTLNPSSGVDCLSAVPQGTTEQQHLGRTMYMIGIYVHGDLEMSRVVDQTLPENDIIVRICLVLDSDTKGVELVASDVMDTGPTTQHLAFRNLQHTSRLRVLKEKSIVVRPLNMAETINAFAHGQRRQPFKINVTFKKPIRVLFKGTTGVVGSIVDNSLHVIACASEGGVNLGYQSRLRFRDNL